MLKVLVLNVLLVLMVRAPSTSAAQVLQRDGVISGQVVDAAGRPVSAAIVSIGGTGISSGSPGAQQSDPPRILTGNDGRFVFRHLMDGSFTITVVKGGYAEGASGRRRPGGSTQAILVNESARTVDTTIRVWKYAVIAGTVLDEAGEPVVNVQVRALRRVPGATPEFAAATVSPLTDDRGAYRLSALLPGDYLVMASRPGVSAPGTIFEDVARTGQASGELVGLLARRSMDAIEVGGALYGVGGGAAVPPPPVGTRMQIYPTTFHPSTTAPAQAAIVSVASGEERTSVDIQLVPVTTSRVSGTLLAPTGPASMVSLRLTPTDAARVGAEALESIAVSDAAGTFVFAAVVPGRYTLRAQTGESPEPAWLAMPIVVSGDDSDGIVAVMQPPLRITARAEFDGIAPPPAADGRGRAAVFSLEADDGRTLPGRLSGSISPQGASISGFMPGRYRVRVANSPRGWMFKAAMLDGVDVSLTPFELTRDISDLVLTFTDRWSGISGDVAAAEAAGAVVLAFPTDAQSWIDAGRNPRRLRSARVDAGGRFAIGSLPPGDYYVVAIADEQSADWRDSATLETLARLATAITIADGEHKTLDLRLQELRR